MFAVDQFDAGRSESLEVVVPCGPAWAATVRGKMIMGTVATNSHRTVRAWLSVMLRVKSATPMAVKMREATILVGAVAFLLSADTWSWRKRPGPSAVEVPRRYQCRTRAELA